MAGDVATRVANRHQGRPGPLLWRGSPVPITREFESSNNSPLSFNGSPPMDRAKVNPTDAAVKIEAEKPSAPPYLRNDKSHGCLNLRILFTDEKLDLRDVTQRGMPQGTRRRASPKVGVYVALQPVGRVDQESVNPVLKISSTFRKIRKVAKPAGKIIAARGIASKVEGTRGKNLCCLNRFAQSRLFIA